MKPQIEAVTEAIEAGIEAGVEPIEAVRDVLAKVKITSYLGSRKRAERDSRYIRSRSRYSLPSLLKQTTTTPSM